METQIFTPPPTLITNGGTTYEPWTDGYAIGFKVTTPGKLIRYVYLNPSNDDGEPEVSTPDVFLYIGELGDSAQDGAEHYYDTDFDHAYRCP